MHLFGYFPLLLSSSIVVIIAGSNNFPPAEVSGAKILFYFSSSIHSHRVAIWPLVEGLAKAGHKITFLSPFPSPGGKNPNVTEFHPKSLQIFLRDRDESNKTLDVITSRIRGYNDGTSYWNGVMQTALELCRVVFRSSEVQKWVEESEFDLVIIDTPFNECALALAHKFNAPHILFGTASLYMWHPEMFGLPDESSWLPDYYNSFPMDMTFFQRVKNALSPLQWFYSTNRVSYVIPQMEKLMRKTLNISDMPSLEELEKSTSVFLLNTHFSQEYPRSLPPFVIPVGGMHCGMERDEVISEELSKFLEEHGKNGFVYLSFGSLVEFSKAPVSVVEKFMNTFTTLGLPVLWRWDGKIPEDIPENIFMAKSFPQNKLLVHPDLKVFITHGGILSYQEAVYYGVPLIVFPLNPEEDFNAGVIEKSVAGIRLDIGTFTQYEIATSIKRIIKDETYQNNMRRLSTLFKDRPQHPIDTALWWTEYVLRHKNLTSTKPYALSQPWYQRRLLDVWAFLICSLIALLTVLIMGFNYIFCAKQPQPKSKHKYKTS